MSELPPKLVGPPGHSLRHLDTPTKDFITAETNAVDDAERRTTDSPMVISLIDDGIDTKGMIHILAVVALKQSGQETDTEQTGKPSMFAYQSTIGCKQLCRDAIRVPLVVKVQGLAWECPHNPVEEIVIGFDAFVAVLPQLRHKPVGIP